MLINKRYTLEKIFEKGENKEIWEATDILLDESVLLKMVRMFLLILQSLKEDVL